MRCAEAHPYLGGMIEPYTPGFLDIYFFQIYMIYYRQLKQDVLGSLTKTYIFYFVWGLDCDRVSELHCSLPVGSAGVRLLSMMIPDSCASDSGLDPVVLSLSTSLPLFSIGARLLCSGARFTSA